MSQEPVFGDPWKNLFYGALGLPAVLYQSGWVFWMGVGCCLLGGCMAVAGWLVKR